MKHLLVVVLMVFTSSVFAQAIHHNNVAIGGGGAGGAGGAGGQGGAGGKATSIAIGAANSVSKSSANANSKSNSHSSSYASQYQGQHQNQTQGQLLKNQNKSSSNNNGGNVQITNVHRKNLRSAPSFGLPAAFPTAVCQGTAAAGFSFWLGGGAVAGTITIEECMKLETIRVGTIMMQNSVTVDAALLQQEANTAIFCMTKYGEQTPMCTQARDDNNNGDETASAETATVVSVAEPVKVASIPDETFEPEDKKVKIWFFGL